MRDKGAIVVLFGNPETRTFGKFKGVGADYSFTLMDVPHQGSAFTFVKGGKTITLMLQEAVRGCKPKQTWFSKV